MGHMPTGLETEMVPCLLGSHNMWNIVNVIGTRRWILYKWENKFKNNKYSLQFSYCAKNSVRATCKQLKRVCVGDNIGSLE